MVPETGLQGHWEWSLPECLSSSVVPLHPTSSQWNGSAIHAVMWVTRDTQSPNVEINLHKVCLSENRTTDYNLADEHFYLLRCCATSCYRFLPFLCCFQLPVRPWSATSVHQQGLSCLAVTTYKDKEVVFPFRLCLAMLSYAHLKEICFYCFVFQLWKKTNFGFSMQLYIQALPVLYKVTVLFFREANCSFLGIFSPNHQQGWILHLITHCLAYQFSWLQ